MKREDLPLVTPEQFRKRKPCWLGTREGRARFRSVAAKRPEWNALDVLDLDDVSARDKLWAVLHEAFLPPMLLNEFACRCAEWALSFIDSPDPSSVEVIRVKRRWMAGEATDDELRFSQMAAAQFAARSAACASASAAEWSAQRKSAREQEIDMLRTLIDEWDEQV